MTLHYLWTQKQSKWDDFWAQKSSENDDFWSQKASLWLWLISGPINRQNGTISGPRNRQYDLEILYHIQLAGAGSITFSLQQLQCQEYCSSKCKHADNSKTHILALHEAFIVLFQQVVFAHSYGCILCRESWTINFLFIFIFPFQCYFSILMENTNKKIFVRSCDDFSSIQLNFVLTFIQINCTNWT